MSVAPFGGIDIIGLVIIFRDVSEEQKLEETKNSFISVISHQLRTPLTSVRWFIEMLLGGDAGPLTPEQRDFAGEAYAGAGRMVSLIDLLLQITRVEAGRLKMEPVPLNIDVVTREIITGLASQLAAKHQRVEVHAAPSLPTLNLNKDALWQVILNLLANASRYSPAGGSIVISIVSKNKLVEYAVKDNGIGIPENQKNRIFEKFFRASNAVKTVSEGSGLGLFLVKSLVESWNGRIRFESEEGKGTTFYFTIPLAEERPKKKVR